MPRLNKRLTLLATLLFALFALLALLVAAPALAVGGDYGINTGAGAQSTCGGTSGPSCTISYNGHPATYEATNNDGSHSYNFDDYACTIVIATDATVTLGGEECDMVTS